MSEQYRETYHCHFCGGEMLHQDGQCVNCKTKKLLGNPFSCPTCDSLRKENEELKRKQQDGAKLITTAAEVMGEIAGLRKENEELRGQRDEARLRSDHLSETVRLLNSIPQPENEALREQVKSLRAQLKSANEQLDEARKLSEQEVALLAARIRGTLDEAFSEWIDEKERTQ